MKILVITNMFPSDSSKYNTLYGVFIKETHDYLKKFANIDSIVIFTNIYKKGAFWSVWKHSRLALKTLIASILEDYDIVHAHYAVPSGLLGLIPKYLKGKKLVLTTHGSDINILPYKNRFTHALVRFTLIRSDKIIAVSKALKEKIIKDFGIDERKIVVIPCGVDIDRFRPMEKEILRRRLNLPSDKFIALHLATLSQVKRTDIIIKAFQTVIKNRKNAFLVIAGDGPCRQDLVELTNKLNLTENILFTGYIQRKDVPLWIASADLFVLASESEGTPVTALEALASGVPIIATDVGGLKEIVDDENIGTLVKVGDPIGLANAIMDIIASKNVLDRSTIRAKSKQYSWEEISQKVMGVYAEVIKNRQQNDYYRQDALL